MQFKSTSLLVATLALVAGMAASSARAEVAYEYPRQMSIDSRAVVATHPLKLHAMMMDEMKLDIVINFETGSDKLTKEDKAKLAKVAEIVESRGASHVMVVGYTDNVGKATANQELSYRRALRVAHVLGKKFGLGEGMTVVKGMGSANPVATNSTAAGRAANRRVEFVVAGGRCTRW